MTCHMYMNNYMLVCVLCNLMDSIGTDAVNTVEVPNSHITVQSVTFVRLPT